MRNDSTAPIELGTGYVEFTSDQHSGGQVGILPLSRPLQVGESVTLEAYGMVWNPTTPSRLGIVAPVTSWESIEAMAYCPGPTLTGARLN